MTRRTLILIAAALAVARAAGAQSTAPATTTPSATPATSATPAASDSARTMPAPGRLSWTSDRLPLRVGDLLTVVVDEQTTAREQVSQVAQGDRSLRGDLNAGIGEDDRIGPTKSIGSVLRSDSREVGEAGHRGDLSGVLTVRVVSIAADGTAQVEGSKKVNVDGRPQEIVVRGLVRPQDVSASNCVPSSRVANAEITYKGKKIAPHTSFIGRILGMLWP
ncbi:MAG TPA: flagellar basal body L-ring protein FlgH [Terriglobales bacterium]|nr:flagellar basal body L-ring protein FlgH [Terriglobales bacterium]